MTASILALLGAGGKVGTACKKIIALRHAPAALMALNNEVTDLHILVQDVDDILRQNSETSETDTPPSVTSALKRTRATLLRLETLIAYELMTPSAGNESRLDRSVWLRAESRVQKLKDDIRADRVALTSALGLLTSSISLRGVVHAKQLSVSLAGLDATIHETRDVIVRDIQSSLRGVIYSNEQNQKPQVATEGLSSAVVRHVSGRSVYDGFNNHTASSRSLNEGFTMRTENGLGAAISPLIVTEAHTARITLLRSSCAACGCPDSRQLKYRSPSCLNTILGTLFVGYRASPWSKQTCDHIDCRQDSTALTFTYVFPQWLLNRVFLTTMAYNSLKGPELCLRVMRVRPNDADIFRVIETRAFYPIIGHVKRLLNSGEASILDVRRNNQTVLSLAIRVGSWDVAELLIRLGADPYYEDSFGLSAFTEAWSLYLAKPWLPEDEQMVRTCHLLGSHSDFALFGFSELHRAYLGISGVTFEDVLSSTPRSSIDGVDRTGLTTLSWACRQGDTNAVARLLSCGADPDKADVRGRTPLHWSTTSSDDKCMELLLAAKADVNLKDLHGQTALSLSARKDSLDCIEILVAADADIESEGSQGWRPLHSAVFYDRSSTVSHLLRSGADINARTSTGSTAMLVAIDSNCHRSLNILLGRPELDIHVVNGQGMNALHLLAAFGDEETIQVLRSAKWHGFDTTKLNTFGCSALDLAQWRCDCNEEWSQKYLRARDSHPIRWYNAFKLFMEELKARQEHPIDGKSSDWETVTSEQSTEDVSCEDSDDGAAKDEEVWQDAHQYPETEGLEPRDPE